MRMGAARPAVAAAVARARREQEQELGLAEEDQQLLQVDDAQGQVRTCWSLERAPRDGGSSARGGWCGSSVCT